MAHSTHWYQIPLHDVLHHHKSRPDVGLDPEEVNQRRIQFGQNEITRSDRKTAFQILVRQFSDFLILVLIGAAVIAGALGEPEDTYAIAAIVLINALLGFFQEYRAEKAVEALRQLSTPTAKVKRGGRTMSVPALELVPGDIILLKAGGLVPADLRLIEAHQLRIDESTLTGESVPVEKIETHLPHPELVIGDQRNMAFKGTLVTNGRAIGVVTSTGMETELGRIAKLLQQEVEVRTPLQERLTAFSKRLALLVIAICILIFIVGVARGESIILMFMTALSLAVAAIPEALPAVITVSLSLGARKMASKNAFVRKLPAVETLGSVTYICSDKTGTLTENRMRVEKFQLSSATCKTPDLCEKGWHELFQVMALSNDAEGDRVSGFIGDPTETALAVAASENGFNKKELENQFPRVAEIAFSSERGLMSTIHKAENEFVMFTKGAPERILKLCSNSIVEQFDLERELFESKKLAESGYRVLALAMRKGISSIKNINLENEETNLTFLGFVGLVDPPRAEAESAIRACHSSGIVVVMITGDHPATALAIAKKLNIASRDQERVITGTELNRLSDDEFSKLVRETHVYARVAPEQKIRIVKALQARGEVVAMTGDGVNDAPALRRANIGTAMGKQGTDVAREAAHMVLLDDNFATIVSAVKEGRRLYDNIRKFVRFALTGNSAEIWALFLAPFLGLPIPFLPIQILWINLVTDGLPGLALAAEPAERDVMNRNPRPPNESIFAHGLWQHTLWVGILIAGITLAVQAWAYSREMNWQSMAFTVLAISQMGHVLAIRSDKYSLFTIGMTSNMPLLSTVVFTIGFQLAVLYLPAINNVLKTSPLSTEELAICFAASSVVFVAVEIEKFFKRRCPSSSSAPGLPQ